jgi:hypothetical protein
MRFLLLLGTVVAQIAICNARTEVEELVVQMLAEAPQKTDLGVITPANRDAVIKILRDAATYKVVKLGTSPLDETGAEIVLVRLNDTETITRVIGQYRDTYGSRGSFWLAGHLELAGQASVVPLLAEDFFLEDGDKSTIKKEGSGVGFRVIPRSAFSGITALRVTIASKQFSEETRAWANQRLTQSCYPFDKFRAEMRVWWRQNKDAFEKADYKAVKPMKPETITPIIATPAPPQPTPTPKPAPELKPEPPPTPLPKEPAVDKAAPLPPVRQGKPVWIWITASCAVAVGGWLLLKRRK